MQRVTSGPETTLPYPPPPPPLSLFLSLVAHRSPSSFHFSFSRAGFSRSSPIPTKSFVVKRVRMFEPMETAIPSSPPIIRNFRIQFPIFDSYRIGGILPYLQFVPPSTDFINQQDGKNIRKGYIDR